MVSGCSKLLQRRCLVRRGAIVNLSGPIGSRFPKKIVVATCADITVGNNPPLLHDTRLGEIALVMPAQKIILHLEREAFIGANEGLA